MNLTVLGGGAWGTALAVSASARHATRLWARDASQVAQMRSLRRNGRYLGEVALPPALHLSSDLAVAMEHARDGLLIVATPMAALGELLAHVPADGPGVLWLCKGFQQGTGRLGHEVAQATCPQARVGVLS
ncbi:MAG: glycerol-3-phosphate dehydrogenase, partial [Methylibium sp. NZG]